MKDRPIRVGFDGRALTSPAAGVRRYARSLLDALASLPDAPEVVILGGDPSATPHGATRIAEPWHPPTNAGWMLVGLPLAASRGRVDVLHAPAYTAPFWSGVPTVLTIHDVSYARHPEWFPYRRDALRRAFYRRSALSAGIVITDSHFSAAEINAAYGIDPARIVVVPLGVDASFGGSHASTAPLPGGVSPPFVLHVGDLHERRNLGMALDAVLQVRRDVEKLTTLSLVFAGVDRGVGDALRAQAAASGAPDAVAMVGAVEEGPLRSLYDQALALLYPSLYEGFGLPLIEAMACGTPVVASKAASIPEVVGDAGLLLDPHATLLWAEAIAALGLDDRHRSDLCARGLVRAATFTWEKTAQQTLEVYRAASSRIP